MKISIIFMLSSLSAIAMEQTSQATLDEILDKADEVGIQMLQALKANVCYTDKVMKAKVFFNKSICALCHEKYSSRANTRRHFFTYCLTQLYPEQLPYYKPLIEEWDREQLEKAAWKEHCIMLWKKKQAEPIDSDMEEADQTPPAPTYSEVCFVPGCQKGFTLPSAFADHLKNFHNF